MLPARGRGRTKNRPQECVPGGAANLPQENHAAVNAESVRGRGRGREENKEFVAAKGEFFEDAVEQETPMESARGRGRGRRERQEYLQGKAGDLVEGPTAGNSTYDRGETPKKSELVQFQFSTSDDEETSSEIPTRLENGGKCRKMTVHPEELRIELKRKLTVTASLPRRPDEGTLGKRIKLISNCFPIKVPSGNVYHYDVNITRKRKDAASEESNTGLLPAGADREEKYRCLSTRINREIITLLLSENPVFNDSYAAYDGRKNLYTRNPIRADFPMKCEVHLPDDNDNPDNPRYDVFQVKIKPVLKKDSASCAISLDMLHAFFEKRTSFIPQETVMALETILRHGPCLRFTPVGRSFFYPPTPGNIHPLGGGLEIWFGYHQSVRLGQWGPMVNLDVTATTFYQKGPVLSYIADVMHTTVGDLRRRPYLPNTDIKKISNKLKNMRVEVTHLRNYRRKYRIFRMVKESANRLEFDITENGRTVKKTVAAYFRERYNRNLEFPHLPCLQVYPENKKTYLPVEVCEFVEGQHSRTKLEPKQTAEMIKFTSRPPNHRFSEIIKIANNFTPNSATILQEFDLEVSPEPIQLEGRVLDPPSVCYSGDKGAEVIKPRDGSWNMKRSKFFRPASIDSWVLLSFAKLDPSVLQKFGDQLVKISKEVGILIKSPAFTGGVDDTTCDLRHLLQSMKDRYKAQLAVIIIPGNDKSLYGRIKKDAETVVGLATQCVKDISVTKKCSPQLVHNICQKINAKMGGENNSLLRKEIPDIMKKPVIIIGADVNHPGASRGVKPSLAACVGSLSLTLSRYAVSIRAQTNVDQRKQAVEIIQDLKNMIIELLKAFYRNTKGKKPEKIIIYRDGVSEGQFETVREHEVRCIREACRSLGTVENYEPGITFILVQKRHHIRFSPQDPRDGVGNMKNIPPGTTVDSAVTHPLNFDFFLCSHYGLKGTSRPSHYTVVEDDNEFNSNDLQILTYQLCHTSARCTKSISVPVPVAYAHLAAYRARHHLEASLEESTSSSDSSFEYQPLSKSVIDSIKTIPGLESAMYFV